jgi:hypothetical protein
VLLLPGYSTVSEPPLLLLPGYDVDYVCLLIAHNLGLLLFGCTYCQELLLTGYSTLSGARHSCLVMAHYLHLLLPGTAHYFEDTPVLVQDIIRSSLCLFIANYLYLPLPCYNPLSGVMAHNTFWSWSCLYIAHYLDLILALYSAQYGATPAW